MTNTDVLREELIQARLAGRARGRDAGRERLADRSGPLPLSFGQQGIWFLSRLHPDSPEYLVPFALRMRGPLDAGALRTALARLVARHEVLRTRYELSGGEPVQVIDEPPAPALPVVDVADPEQALREDAYRPIDIEREHPLRARLLRLGPRDHVLSLVLHHIACDFRSLGIIVDELGALYREQATGEPSGLPEPGAQYADYAVRQRDRVSGAVLDRRLRHWRETLDALVPTDLPTDHARPAARTWDGAEAGFHLPAELAGRLSEVAAASDTTLFVLLLTCFQALLARYTGVNDVVVGSAVAARTRAAEQRMIGYLQNTLVLRARWTGDPTMAELVGRGTETMLGALDNQEIPLHLLVDAAGHDRSLSRAPLFQVMFDLVEGTAPPVEMPGLTCEPVEVGGGTAKFDLTLQLAENADGSLLGGLSYATALFDRPAAERMVDHYRRLVEAVAGDPRTRLSAIDILGPGGRHTLLAAGDGGPGLPPQGTVSEMVAHHAVRTPDAAAVRFLGDDARPGTSYAELDAQANRVARHLLELGAGPESVVGVCLDRGAALLPALLGVWRAGAAYVPLDPDHPGERLAQVLDDAGAELLVTQDSLADRAAAAHRGRTVLLDRDAALIAAHSAEALDRPTDPDALAYVIYTSGSTGRPNGVLVSHRNLASYLAWASATYVTGDGNGAPLFSSPAFDLVVTTLYVPLLAGRPVHVVPAEVGPGRLGEVLARNAPYDFVKLTPGHLDLLTAQLTPARAATLTGVLVVGGEGFPTGLAARWPHTRVINEYGPTETTVADALYEARGGESGDLLPIGRPAPGTTAYVLDADLGLLPAGAVGELHVGGDQVARGYRGKPGLTADRFRPDPYGTPGARLYRTGDACRVLPDGDLRFLGRADEQLKIRGYRVEPAEIDAATTRHPSVAAAVTLMKDGLLTCYFVPAGRTPDTGELQRFLGETLPAYMVPAVFVPLETIPLTANGKVDRRALPAPRRDEPSVEGRTAPAAGPQEQLAAVWRSVLRLSEVGADDSFFDIGGDSLHAVALVGALRECGLDIAVQDVFEHPTIAELAELVAARPQEAAPAAGVRPFELLDPRDAARVPPDAEDAYPLSMVQAGMVYEMVAADGANHYHNTTTYRIRDGRPFSVEAMRAAAEIVVGRHEVLRTSLHPSGYGEPLQIVHRDARLQVDVSDLRGLGDDEQERRVLAFMAEERRTLFDLERPSLLRMRAHVRRDDQWTLTITECHPILEGWSYNLLFMELLTCYDALREGREPAPEQMPAVRYADFVAAERAALASEADRAYWRDLVADAEKFELPPAWADPSAPDGEQYKIQVRFDDLIDGLTAAAQQAKVPLKSVMHLAHLKVMSMITPQREFFTGLVCDARPEVAGAERVLGMFLNTVPFRFRPGAGTWRRAAADVFAEETRLWPHRRFPVPAMQREFSGGRRLIDVMFNFLDFREVDTDLVDVFGTVDDSPNDFPLSVTAFRLGIVDLTVHARAVSRERGEMLAAAYRTVLEAIAADPDGDALASYLPAPLEVEHTERPVPEAPPVHEILAGHAGTAPDRAAVVHDGGTVTYAELDAGANRLAHHLRALGAGPGTVVGVCLDAGPAAITAVLGVLKAGAAYLPLDPSNPGTRLCHCLADSGALLLITERAVPCEVPARPVNPTRDRDQIAARPDTPPPVRTDPDDLAYVIYTSGSTGRPKGVMVTHRGLGAYLAWAAARYGPPAGHGAPLLGSIAFDLSVTNLLLPLFLGRDVEVLPHGEEVEFLAGRLRAGTDYTVVKATPSHLDLLRGALEAGGDASGAVGAAITLVVGGEELREDTVAAWRRIAPAARIVNEYGPTETVVGCVVHEARGEGTGAVPIGRPIAGATVRLLDAFMRPVPEGVAGEIFIGGLGVARGYMNRPALTARSFVPDPYGPPGSRLYRSGDLGVLGPEGELEFLGRIDDQVKIRGYRIELGEIEARLRAHPAVRDAVVATRPGPRGAPRLVAYVAGDAGPDELAGFLRADLPAYMIPQAYVRLDALPVSPSGKADRRRLPEPEGHPDGDRPPYAEPVTGPERVLAEVWAATLGLERAGADDDFFDLGGDSILVMRAVTAARAAGVAVTPRLVTRHRTVRAVAAASREAGAAPARHDVASGPLPPTPILLAFAGEAADLTEYTQVAHLVVDPPPDPAPLEQALRDVVSHHDALRVRRRDGGYSIAPDEPEVPLDVVDLPAGADAMRDLIRRPTGSGPAVHATLFTSGDGPAQLAIAAHRLAVDGVSWQFLLDDLATAYRRREEGLPADLPPKTTSFRTWAHRLAEHARSTPVRGQLGYWLTRGPHTPVAPDLPDGDNTPAGIETLSARVDLARPPAGLRDALLAALLLTVTRVTGSDRLLVELEEHGRRDVFPDLDVSRTAGWFTTLHPVELRLAPDQDATLAAVSAALCAVPDGGLGHGLLRHLGDDADARALAALPEPQIRFNYTGWSPPEEAGARFARAPGGPSPARPVSGVRSREFEIDASLHDGVLEAVWAYPSRRYARATVRALAESHLADLTTLLKGKTT
ncbi:amino acid adenylation domain-containing protein [Sphaerisporangium aureirubrum]|uniref:Amino acid adenylation domain-containing protein n=1 Tax=Sphaerisporangium aureirubrum TaxID=1544736 RepID=A0ABW1NBN7_9ACTN